MNITTRSSSSRAEALATTCEIQPHAAAYANSGAVYRDAEEHGLAIEYYLKALESLPDNANASNQAIMNLQLGKLYINTQEYPEAKERLFAGRNIGLKFGHDLRVHNANLSLAETAFGTGTA